MAASTWTATSTTCVAPATRRSRRSNSAGSVRFGLTSGSPCGGTRTRTRRPVMPSSSPRRAGPCMPRCSGRRFPTATSRPPTGRTSSGRSLGSMISSNAPWMRSVRPVRPSSANSPHSGPRWRTRSIRPRRLPSPRRRSSPSASSVRSRASLPRPSRARFPGARSGRRSLLGPIPRSFRGSPSGSGTASQRGPVPPTAREIRTGCRRRRAAAPVAALAEAPARGRSPPAAGR